ncbi:adenylosuccinate synthetase [Mesorhizobium sp. Mes31]|uniref:adenylosuccinate synthetase n=1 Tax=Mesorhizobium sp. Mes31 TaxID=2926017 RepID=UPI0021194E54|nr:adenylosuccinate synthetase [Mesorhizobium sp. Mes31]
MPVSIVVGGQFGSEGKGKVALEIARRSKAPVTLVRVGGPNSGHTGYDRAGKKWALRQLPAGCVDRNVDVVFPAGSYINVEVLLNEIEVLHYPRDRVFISPFARIITEQHRAWERDAGLVGSIGSTGSGVGGAVMAAAAREAANFPLESPTAEQHASLQPFIDDISERLRKGLNHENRVIIEGTQGFGLSLLEGGYWPKSTSRSTTAAGALAEAGLSPLDVDDVTMVIRSFPIRVSGDSGPLLNETTWAAIASGARLKADIREYTTVTQKLRRVGHFDVDLVKRACLVNRPRRLVLNHLDYIGPVADLKNSTSALSRFVADVESWIDKSPDWLGFDGLGVVENFKSCTWNV